MTMPTLAGAGVDVDAAASSSWMMKDRRSDGVIGDRRPMIVGSAPPWLVAVADCVRSNHLQHGKQSLQLRHHENENAAVVSARLTLSLSLPIPLTLTVTKACKSRL